MTNSFTIGFNQSDNNMPYSTVCDNCQGQFLDLVHRMRSFKQRRYFLAPTGDQFILICSIYLIEGSMGLMGWNENMRMTIELKNAAKTIANVLPTIARFLKYPQSFYPLSKTNPYPKDYFIANLWIDPENNSVLLIAANLGSQEVSWTVNLPKLPFSSDSEPKIRQLYRSNGSTEVQIFGAEKDQLKVNGKLNSYGFGAWEFAFGRRLQGEGIQEKITTSK
ncbi:expressed protein [Phakopsora pachyrhizi]|uniref:Expressed protein n=1 Tax=Phakopsora pachyrhizi TaxID=170000 RepID=A0AAV0B0I2_PHAPC|nr:expressed protein [Phakopsora pachyrhizi]